MCFFNLAEKSSLFKICPSPPWKLWFAYAFLSKLTQFSQRNNVLDAPSSKKDGFISRDTCVSLTYLKILFRTKWPFLPKKTMTCTMYSLQKLTQFLQRNNVLYAATSFIDCSQWWDTFVSSNQLRVLLGANRAFFQLETPQLQEVFFWTTKSVLTRKQCARWSSF
jgi:hypothetical protein